MISDNAVKRLMDLYPDDHGWYDDIQARLRDFTNEDVRRVLTNNDISCLADIVYVLYRETDDLEIKAHLQGFESEEARQRAIKRVKELIHDIQGY